jgi:hypothetical protein
MRKLDVPEMLRKCSCLILAARGQRNVRAAGVQARERPRGFAVQNAL